MRWILILILCLATTPGFAQGKKKDRRRDVDLKVGSVAPDFTVKDVEGAKSVQLAALRGKPVVLIFGSCT